MTNSEALARIYETYSVEELIIAKDEPEAEIVERFFGDRETSVATYSEIQREFGWDDTH